MTDPIVSQIYDAVEQLTSEQRRQLFALLGAHIDVPRSGRDVLSDLASMKNLDARTPSLAGRYAQMGRNSEQDDTIAVIREIRSDWENERDDLLAPYHPSDDPR